MRVLDRKLLRDLGRMKGQVATIAVVVACGVAVFIAALTMYHSLQWSQHSYYASARFAQVYARLKRAPATVSQQIRDIPGISEVEARIVHDVTLDLPQLVAPAVGRVIGVPSGGQPHLNRLYLRRGRLIEPGHANEVVVSESFATANGLRPGDTLAALLNGHRETLRIVGVVLSAEYVFALCGGEALPDDRQFGVLWMDHEALAAAFNMKGAFNDVILTLAPRVSEQAVIDALEHVLEPYGSLGAYGRDQQVSHRFVSDEIYQQEVVAIELLASIPLGLWLGYWIVVTLATRHQAEMFRIPPIIAPRSYAIAALIVLTAGAISALIVRHRVDHLDLVSVLKTRE